MVTPVTDDLVGLLPHRPPFRFVDAVDECDPGVSALARYRVTGDEAFLAGHFPGNPIMPGVLMIEALAQAGAVAVLSQEENRGKLALFAGIDDVRFKRVVRPGDELTLTCELQAARGRIGRGVARATVDGELAVRAVLTFAVGER